MVQHLWKKIWQFLTKLNKHLPYDPAVSLNLPTRIENTCSQKTYPRISIAAFVTIACVLTQVV